MDTVDASHHYSQTTTPDHPSLLTLILDTNPYYWSTSPFPLTTALSHLQIFLNAHLSFSHSNRVAVIASHVSTATLLYPTSVSSVDVRDPNKYRAFRLVEEEVQGNFRKLMADTRETELAGRDATMLAGALCMALAYINRASGGKETGKGVGRAGEAGRGEGGGITSRILVVSVSGAGDMANQYIPTMNAIFAAQRLKVPIDICKLSGDRVFLQQASDATKGIYMELDTPANLLQYLMVRIPPDPGSPMIYISDPTTRRHLVPPSQENVDFRAACFCHKRIVDLGFVCSICLSIFCTPPESAVCTTCNTKLDISSLGNFGGRPAVLLAKKKKSKKVKKVANADNATNASTPGTPIA
ncbi:RNA polymerase II transcription factor B subunit 4 [Rhizina undulata]